MTHPTFQNVERQLALDEAACATPCPLAADCRRAHPRGGEQQTYFHPDEEPCGYHIPRDS